MGKHSKPLDVAGKETPLMKQYNRIKVKHPDTVLLFRVGDFYETLGQMRGGGQGAEHRADKARKRQRL